MSVRMGCAECEIVLGMHNAAMLLIKPLSL